MPFTTGDDRVRIYYEERGSGLAVLLSHGFRANLAMWQRQMDALSDRYHIIAWDVRGHGRSDSPEDPALYSHEAAVADMAAVLDACGVERAVVGGLSLGGFISLAFHLAHPDRTLALMLLIQGRPKRGPDDLPKWPSRTVPAQKVSNAPGAGCWSMKTTASSSRSRQSACPPWCCAVPKTQGFLLQLTTWSRRYQEPRR